jgi:hypothetical protein
MSYVPNNNAIFIAAFSGAAAGMGVNRGVPLDSHALDYTVLMMIAGAWAQAFDTSWGANPNSTLDTEMAQSLSEEAWGQRTPGPQNVAKYLQPLNWKPQTDALVAQITAAESYFSGQGISPSPPSSAGALVLTRYVSAPGQAVDPAGGDIDLCVLSIPVVAGQVLDLSFDAWINGNGTNAQLEFKLQIDGGLINDNGQGQLLDEVVQFANVTIGEVSLYGGSYNRIARVIGLGTGTHVAVFTVNATGSGATPNVNNASIRAYVVSA